MAPIQFVEIRLNQVGTVFWMEKQKLAIFLRNDSNFFFKSLSEMLFIVFVYFSKNVKLNEFLKQY